MKSTVGTELRILIHVPFVQLPNENVLYVFDYIKVFFVVLFSI